MIATVKVTVTVIVTVIVNAKVTAKLTLKVKVTVNVWENHVDWYFHFPVSSRFHFEWLLLLLKLEISSLSVIALSSLVLLSPSCNR